MDKERQDKYDRAYDALGVLAKSSEYAGPEYMSLRIALNHLQEAEMRSRMETCTPRIGSI